MLRLFSAWITTKRSVPKPTHTDGGYFPSQDSCQIPNISFLFERFLGPTADGFFVEVGAFDGVFVSNTWGLAERGWRGLLIEPIPDFAEECRVNHKKHPNVTVVEVGIGSPETSELKLAVAGTLTSGDAKSRLEVAKAPWARGVDFSKEVTVASATLDYVLETHSVPAAFDVLVVDVEGLETEVFAGFSLHSYKPKMIIVELLDTHRELSSLASSDGDLGIRLAKSGYVVVFKDSINTVFVEEKTYREALSRVSHAATIS